MPKPKHGGKRPGAGRPTRDGEKRVPLNTRIAASTDATLRAMAAREQIGIGQVIDILARKTMSTKPSPTPWSIYEVTEIDGVLARGFKDANGVGVNDGDSFELFSPENAALIVRAVNNHERLVKALREMLHYADWHARGRSEANDSDECKRARALISELEQETQ